MILLREHSVTENNMLHFDTDYMRGAHPEVMRRLVETNLIQTPGYGSDEFTARATQKVLQACGLTEGKVLFLAGGTQTNATVIDSIVEREQGVLAVETAHINVHEAGAVEAHGHKVLTLPSHNGKMDADELQRWLDDFYRDDTHEHMVAPGAVYITHPTEVGTLYTLSELEAIHAVCRKAGIKLYLDGARLGYGLSAEGTDVTLTDIARLCDVFYIGGTKVGALFGEAVVVCNPTLFRNALTLIKRHGALLAKGRLISLQFETLFTDDLYLRLARSAVQRAMQLKKVVLEAGFELFMDSPTNQQFFVLPNTVIDRLSGSVTFELWGPRGETQTPVRFVTDWATSEHDIETFAQILKQK